MFHLRFLANHRLLSLMPVFFLLLQAAAPAQTETEFGLRFYPEDVDDFNKITAVPEYKGGVRVHEKFWMNDRIIGPRSHAPSWVKFENVDFDDGFDYLLTRYSVDSYSGRTVVDIRLDSPDPDGLLIGDFRVENTGGYNHFIDRYIPLKRAEGIRDLYIVFEHSGNYRYFELSSEVPGGFEAAPPADAYQEFVRPDFNLQPAIHHFDEPLPVSDILVDQALLQLTSDGRASFHRGRLRGNDASRHAAAILATAIAQGNTDIFVINKLLEVLRGPRYSILNGETVKTVGNVPLAYAIAMAWHIPEVRSRLTDREQDSIRLYMEAMLIENAFMMADFTPEGNPRGAQRFQMDGSPTYTGGNPNYYERHSSSFMYAASVVGLEDAEDILRNYDHDEMLNKLQRSRHSALSDAMYNRFNSTFIHLIGITRYDARTTDRKARLVEDYITSIYGFDEQGKPFYKGLSVAEMLESPGLVQYVNTLDRTFDKRATQGDYIGQRGMFHEFESSDGGDEGLGASLYLRDDLGYSRHIKQPIWYNLFLRYSGHWDDLDAEKRQLIADRISVGAGDLQAKAGGYWSTNFRGSSFRTISNNEAYIFGEQMMANMGHIRSRLFSDNFEDDNIGVVWHEHGEWTKEVVDTWTGRPQHRMPDIAADRVMQSSGDGTEFLVSEYQLDGFNVYVQMLAKQWRDADAGFGIVGRFEDRDNYYAMFYNNDAEALQIVRVHNGESTVLGERSVKLEEERMNYLRGEFSGDLLALYLNSQEMISIRDDAISEGSVGCYSRNAEAQFDNILVTADDYGDLGRHDRQYWLERLLAK